MEYTGTIPTQFGQLSRVVSFDIGTNELSGPVPSQLGLMTGLNNFVITLNDLTSSLPSQIGAFSSIDFYFFFAHNDLTNSIPTEFGRLTSLSSYVQGGSNSLSGQIPTQIGQLRKLTGGLTLSFNLFQSTIPSEVGSLTALSTLFDLATSGLTGSLPTEIGTMTSLTYEMSLNDNELCGDLPTELSALTSDLENLKVSTGNDFGTACPSLAPTAAPTVPTTAVPTTPAPSALPSPLPTPGPTQPTSVPTPSPTIMCQAGEYLDGTTCEPCEAGKYRNSTGAPYVCQLCPAGQYRAFSNDRKDAFACTDCEEGTLSSADRSECTDCQAGEYVFNASSCETCTVGRYAPTAQTDECLACSAGFHTDGQTLGAVACLSCDSGTYSPGLATNCTTCKPGTYSDSRAEKCTPCAVGFYSSSAGASSCTACSAGQHQPGNRSTSCDDCAVGKHQSATGQAACDDCLAGTYADLIGSSLCTSCDAGRFSNTSARNCTACESGTYSSSGASICIACDAGRYSDASTGFSCESCDSGTYSTTGAGSCLPCDAGKFSMTGATTCTNCSEGFYSSTTGSAGCTACDAGFRSRHEGAVTCDPCAVGKHQSATGQAECDECDTGRFASSNATSLCDACDAGTYTASTRSASCVDCPVGKHQSATGQASCEDCTAGRFAESSGASSCEACDAGTFSNMSAATCSDCLPGSFSLTGAQACMECEEEYFQPSFGQSSCLKCSSEDVFGLAYTSKAGAVNCTICVADYYMAPSGDCDPCPNAGVDCTAEGNTLTGLIVRPGYFRFTSTSTEVYPCIWSDNCVGGNSTNDAQRCAKGSNGPLCTYCNTGFFLDAFAGSCTECSVTTANLIGPAVLVTLLLLVLTMCYVFRERLGAWAARTYEKFQERLDDTLDLCTVFVVTMQVIVLLQSNHLQLGGEELQSPYNVFLDVFDFLALDFVRGVPISCIAQAGHPEYVIAWTALPIAVFVGGCVAFQKSDLETRTMYLSYFVQALFLVLPTISTTICETFRCESFDHGDFRYLSVDYNIDCSSSRYQRLVYYACIMCGLYPVGVPLGVIIWLFRYRAHLDPLAEDEATAITLRETDTELKHCAVAVLALRHKPRFWYFEVYSMLRRIVLTSVALVFDTADSMLLFILAVAIVTTVFEREAQPELNPYLSAFVYACHWQVILVIIGMLAVDADLTDGVGTTLIASVLLSCNLAIILVIFLDTRAEILRERTAVFMRAVRAQASFRRKQLQSARFTFTDLQHAASFSFQNPYRREPDLPVKFELQRTADAPASPTSFVEVELTSLPPGQADVELEVACVLPQHSSDRAL